MTDRQRSGVDSTSSHLRVFVSYRRGDTRHVAGRLRDMIVARFGEDSVFVDVESIEPGLDYVAAIDKAVGSCAVMLVLIGDAWLQASDDQGLRRIDDPADRLRLEVEAGLKHKTRVIPVLVDSASMPRSTDLPKPLEPLSRHQATRLRHESFRSDADHLLQVIERVVKGGPVTATPPPRRDTEEDKGPLARWLCLGVLVAVLVALFASRSGGRDAVVASRPDLPSDGPWGSLLWLLPSLPVMVAAWLTANRRRVGIALGCIAGAVVWVSISLTRVVWRLQDPSTSSHVLVLVLLFASMVGLLVAEPRARERPGANRLDRAFLACLLVGAAIILRTQSMQLAAAITSADTGPTDWSQILGRPPFWIACLIPLLIGLPGALLLCNKIQAEALLTLAYLQILYLIVLSPMVFQKAAEKDAASVVFTQDLIFLAGTLCMLLAVLVGQHTKASRTQLTAPSDLAR